MLPGERVVARVVETRRDFDRAVLLEVLEPSPDRVRPACPLAGPCGGRGADACGDRGADACGGCDWMHVDHPAQVALKRAIVAEALRRTGRIERDEPPLAAGAPLAYRSRVQLHRHPSGALGYRAAASDRVVAAGACPVAVAPIEALLADPPSPDRVPLDRFTVFAAGDLAACEGRDDDRDLAVEVTGRRIAFSVGCFFQSNLAALEGLAGFVAAALAAAPRGPGATLADLYAGVGLFGALAGGGFDRVVAVETSAVSLAYARRNVGAERLQAFPMAVEQWVAAGAGGGPFDAVVVDPPRAGLAAAVRTWLVDVRPRTVVYVSCNPVTLARDLGDLVRGGFTLEDLRLFDFYPQTSHVEAAAVLRG